MIYIHYGSNDFDINKFVKIKNREGFTKPLGGLWASSINSEYGWKEWCVDNNYNTERLKENFKFKINERAKILIINNVDKLWSLPIFDKFDKYDLIGKIYCLLDFEELSKQYDAIEVLISKEPQLYFKLYGWDCDSILIMNPNIIEIIK